MLRYLIITNHTTGTDGAETTLAMKYNKGNQLTSMANGRDKIAYTYDRNGSMVQKVLSSRSYGKLTDSYAYNALDQLTEYVGYDGYRQAFTYDANGMRQSRSEAGDANRSTLEELLRDGYRPGGDLFLALSMDGLSGAEGARAMADYLQKLNIKPCFVLDYGGYATMESFRSYLPANVPLALIGVAEKGLLMGQVEAEQVAPGDDPAARLLQGGARLTRRPRQASLCAASRKMLEAIGRKTPGFFKRTIMLHPGLFFPLLRCRWHGRSVFHQFFLSELTVYHLAAYGEPASPARRGELCFRQTVIPGQKTARFRQRLRRRTLRARSCPLRQGRTASRCSRAGK